MGDVVLSAKMSDEELLKSINEAITEGENKFETFTKNINAKLATIGTTLGTNIGSNLTSQLNAVSEKIKAIEAQTKSVSTGKSSSTTTASPSININDYNNTLANDQSIEKLKQMQSEVAAYRMSLKTSSAELKTVNNLYDSIVVKIRQATSAQDKMNLGKAYNMPTNNLDQVESKLQELRRLQQSLNSNPILNSADMQRLDTQISNLTAKVTKLKAEASKPTSMASVMNMSEGTLGDISSKQQAISSLRMSYAANSTELAKLNQEYQRLGRVQKEALTSGVQLEMKTNKLATSFENLGRRLAFYTGVGAITGFVSQLLEVRGQFEMLERSMGAIIGSFQKGSELFRQIQAQALESPMTIVDLATSAKQLIAYNFELSDVADTTKRLADIGSALGVPMERLVYNLGQIKSKGLLDARDARDFANAGLAIVPKLAESYSNLEGRLVTTADVYDRMSKKMVSYNDVMKVLNGLTDEGGMFFDFQAKQAETLKGQLSNLTDSWDLMLNQIGESTDGLLKGSVSLARDMFNNWKQIWDIVSAIAVAFGIYKTAQMVVTATAGKGNIMIGAQIASEKRLIASKLEAIAVTRNLNQTEQAQLVASRSVTEQDYRQALSKQNLTRSQALWTATLNQGNPVLLKAMVSTGLLTQAEIASVTGLKGVSTYAKLAAISLKEMAAALLMNPATWIMAVAGVAFEWWSQASQRADDMEKINADIAEQAKQTVDDINGYLKDNQPTIQLVLNTNMGDAESRKLWENLKEEIEKTSGAASYFVAKLLEIDDVQKRNQAAVNYLKVIRDTADALKDFSGNDVMTTDTGVWGFAGEGLVSDLEDYAKSLKAVKALYSELSDSAAKTKTSIPSFGEIISGDNAIFNTYSVVKDYSSTYKEAQSEITKTYDLITTTINGQGIYLDKNRDQFIESFGQIKAQILKDSPQIKGAMLDMLNVEFDKKLGTHEDAWNKLMQALRSTSKGALSEITSDALDQWKGYDSKSSDALNKILKTGLDKVKKDMPTYYDEIYKMVQNASQLKIQIGIGFNINSGSDFQKEFQDRLFSSLNGATMPLDKYQAESSKYSALKPSGTEDFTEWTATRQNARKKAIEENKKFTTDYEKTKSSWAKKNIDDNNAIIQSNEQVLDMFHQSYESEKDLSKEQKARDAARKKGLNEQADAIKNEIGLIDKLSSNYDKLTKEGLSSKDSVAFLSDEYKSLIVNINKVMTKNHLPTFKIEDFAGKDISQVLAKLEEQKQKLIDAKAKPSAINEMSVEISKIKVEAKVFDLSKINDDLKTSLSNIKDKYELGLDIQANPEIGKVFTDTFKIKSTDIIKSVDEAVQAYQTEWNKYIDKMNTANTKSPISQVDIKTTTPKAFQEMFGLDQSSEVLTQYKDLYNKIFDLSRKDVEENIKNWNTLLTKYGDYETKRLQIQRDSAKERLSFVNIFGTDEQKTQARDLTTQIQISTDPTEVARLAKEEADLVTKIAGADKTKLNIATSINNKSDQSMAGLDFEAFKNTDLYIESFEDLKRVGTSTLDLIYSKLKTISQNPNLDLPQLKIIMKQMKEVRAQLEERDPFGTVITGLKEWKQAQDDINTLKQSEDVKKLAAAQDVLTKAQNKYDLVKKGGGSASEQSTAQTDVDKAQKGVDDAEKAGDVEKLRQAYSNLQAAQAKAKGGLEEINSGFSTFSSLATNGISLIKGIAEGMGIAFDDDTAAVLDNIGTALGLVSAALGIMVVVEWACTAAGAAMLATLWPLLAVAAALAVAMSIFGGKNKKIDKSIKKSEVAVKNLQNAYKDLERAVESSLGTAETEARKAAIANQELQLAELERQLALEKSRSSKKKDKSKIADLEGQIIDLENTISDAVQDIVDNLVGTDIKSAAEDFANTWIDAWRSGEDAMDSLSGSFDDMIDNMIVKSLASTIVANNLQGIYDAVAAYTKEASAGGVELTAGEIQDIANLKTGILEGINTEMTALMSALGIKFGSSSSDLSGLQQGIQSMSEDTGGAIESYMNGVSGQVYLHTTLLQQLIANSEVNMGTSSQILLSLQQGYQVQLAIQGLLNGALSNSGRSFRVELIK